MRLTYVSFAVWLLFNIHSPLCADILYVSSYEGQQILKVDTTAHTATPVLSPGENVESLVYTPSGNIIYDLYNKGAVHMFNPSAADPATTDVRLFNNLAGPADITMDPGAASVLVSDFAIGNIWRYTFATSTATLLARNLGNPEGLAYDSTGRLFATIGSRDSLTPRKYVVQLDPNTGAILAQSSKYLNLDALTFDPITGLLYATSYVTAGKIYSFDPNNLSAPAIAVADVPQPDGIVSNGAGQLFAATRGPDYHIYEYDFASDTTTKLDPYIYGLDDIARGDPTTVPEPATVVLLAIGCSVCTLTSACRKRLRGRPPVS